MPNYGMAGPIAATLIVTALALPAAAHADPNADYLNVMRNTPGVLGGPINEAIYITQGHRACDILHTGTTVDDTINQLTVPMYIQPWLARTMVTAAQQTLCPDTRR